MTQQVHAPLSVPCGVATPYPDRFLYLPVTQQHPVIKLPAPEMDQ